MKISNKTQYLFEQNFHYLSLKYLPDKIINNNYQDSVLNTINKPARTQVPNVWVVFHAFLQLNTLRRWFICPCQNSKFFQFFTGVYT